MIYIPVITFVLFYIGSFYFALYEDMDFAIWLAILASIQLSVTKMLADE